MKNGNIDPGFFQKWKLQKIKKSIFELFQKSMIEVLNSMFERFTPSMIDFWNVQRLIFEGVKDWFFEFFIFSFLKNAPFIFMFKEQHFKNEKWRASKMKNQKWKNGSKMKNQKINYWKNLSLAVNLWGAKGPRADPKRTRAGSTGRGREGVNPSPEGWRIGGLRDAGLRDRGDWGIVERGCL